MTDPVEVNGAQPGIEGQVCEELLAEELWHDGRMETPANVVHLRFSGAWYRLYFDTSEVFWRESEERPEPYEAPEIHCEVRIVDLGALYDVRGRSLERIETRFITRGSEVVLYFAGSRRVCFRNVDDRTRHAA